MWSLVLVGVVAFVITNLDDLAVLTAFSGHASYRLREIICGQYVGFGFVVAVSVVGGVTAARLFAPYVRWLGLLPLVVGLIWLARVRYRNNRAVSSAPIAVGSTSWSRTGLVASIGITDGGDNIAVYVPLFAVLTPGETGIIVGIFLVCAGLWVGFAAWLAARPTLAAWLDGYDDLIVPVVLIAIGLVIVAGVL